MSVWICGVCKDNWETVKQKEIWAAKNKSKTQKIKHNDKILFYEKGTNKFKGIFFVSGGWHKTDRPVWPDENGQVKYSFQIKLKKILLGEASYFDLVSRLSFVRMKFFPILNMASTDCGTMNFGKPILPHDYQIIETALTDSRLKTTDS